MWNVKKIISVLVAFVYVSVFGDCGGSSDCTAAEMGGKTEMSVNVEIGNRNFPIILFDNASTKALVSRMPFTLNMSELNGNEKYNYLPINLPTDSRRVESISTGDLMLYGSNCLVLFYKSFSSGYSYTPLGSITDTVGLVAALGNGDVQVTFSAAE
jgi:hypothetical protein